MLVLARRPALICSNRGFVELFWLFKQRREKGFCRLLLLARHQAFKGLLEVHFKAAPIQWLTLALIGQSLPSFLSCMFPVIIPLADKTESVM